METLHFQGCWVRVGDAPAVSGRARFSRISLPSLSFPRFSVRAAAAVKSGEAQQSAPEVLPKKLREIVSLFEPVTDQRAKYEQLMHYSKRLPPFAEEFRTKENKVVGCVSQVWVRVYLGADGKLYLEADSDSILTKGLAALLVEGLSGSSPEEIIRLTPEFIQMLGLKQSLTINRSNGFYNMFRLIQKKALEQHMNSSSSSSASSRENTDATTAAAAAAAPDPVDSANEVEAGSDESSSGLSMTRRLKIEKKLKEALTPTVLEVEDVSHQHAGHAGVRGAQGGETHFNVKVVSSEFEGRSLLKRHRLVNELLLDEFQSGLHALSIVAKSPSEAK